MKPLISYYGGKIRMAPNIIPLLPPHLNYVEPFCGGAAIMFLKGLPESNPKYQEVISDTNESVINLYRCMKDPLTAPRLIQLIQATAYSRSEYHKATQINKHGHPNRIWRAWALYVSIMQGFSNLAAKGDSWSIRKGGDDASGPDRFQNKIGGSWSIHKTAPGGSGIGGPGMYQNKIGGRWGINQNRRSESDTGIGQWEKTIGGTWSVDSGSNTRDFPKTQALAIKALEQYIERLSKTYIECRPALEVIKLWDSPQTLFYCDPPYVGAEQGHYKGYTQEMFDELLSALESIEGSFLLSCYDNPSLVRYPHWERHAFTARMSAANGKNRKDTKRTELVFRVDRSAGVREDLKPYLWAPTGQHSQKDLF